MATEKIRIVETEEELLFEDEEPSLEEEGQNGAAPSGPRYVETEDEDALRSLIFQTSDVEERIIDIPEWRVPQPDGSVAIMQILLRGLPAADRIDFIRRRMKDAPGGDLKPMYFDIVLMHARHPKTKKLLFKQGDRTELLKKQGKAVERIAQAAIDLSGLSDDFIKELKKR